MLLGGHGADRRSRRFGKHSRGLSTGTRVVHNFDFLLAV
jgi:hypothetical protein